MSRLGDLLRSLWPGGRLFRSTGVRPAGPHSLVVAIGDRSYWVQVRRETGSPGVMQVWTSDVRDISRAATVVAAPPAPAEVVPEVHRRLEAYFSSSAVPVRYC